MFRFTTSSAAREGLKLNNTSFKGKHIIVQVPKRFWGYPSPYTSPGNESWSEYMASIDTSSRRDNTELHQSLGQPPDLRVATYHQRRRINIPQNNNVRRNTPWQDNHMHNSSGSKGDLQLNNSSSGNHKEIVLSYYNDRYRGHSNDLGYGRRESEAGSTVLDVRLTRQRNNALEEFRDYSKANMSVSNARFADRYRNTSQELDVEECSPESQVMNRSHLKDIGRIRENIQNTHGEAKSPVALEMDKEENVNFSSKHLPDEGKSEPNLNSTKAGLIAKQNQISEEKDGRIVEKVSENTVTVDDKINEGLHKWKAVADDECCFSPETTGFTTVTTLREQDTSCESCHVNDTVGEMKKTFSYDNKESNFGPEICSSQDDNSALTVTPANTEAVDLIGGLDQPTDKLIGTTLETSGVEVVEIRANTKGSKSTPMKESKSNNSTPAKETHVEQIKIHPQDTGSIHPFARQKSSKLKAKKKEKQLVSKAKVKRTTEIEAECIKPSLEHALLPKSRIVSEDEKLPAGPNPTITIFPNISDGIELEQIKCLEKEPRENYGKSKSQDCSSMTSTQGKTVVPIENQIIDCNEGQNGLAVKSNLDMPGVVEAEKEVVKNEIDCTAMAENRVAENAHQLLQASESCVQDSSRLADEIPEGKERHASKSKKKRKKKSRKSYTANSTSTDVNSLQSSANVTPTAGADAVKPRLKPEDATIILDLSEQQRRQGVTGLGLVVVDSSISSQLGSSAHDSLPSPNDGSPLTSLPDADRFKDKQRAKIINKKRYRTRRRIKCGAGRKETIKVKGERHDENSEKCGDVDADVAAHRISYAAAVAVTIALAKRAQNTALLDHVYALEATLKRLKTLQQISEDCEGEGFIERKLAEN